MFEDHGEFVVKGQLPDGFGMEVPTARFHRKRRTSEPGTADAKYHGSVPETRQREPQEQEGW